MHWLLDHRIAVFGTVSVVALSTVANYIYLSYLKWNVKDVSERFRRQGAFQTVLFIFAGILLVILWARLLEHTGTFLGILGAGLAIALREPLLSIAGRVAILAGHMYRVGDRIELNKMTGDVINVGVFYTRMMEIGNWIHADQVTGRIVQISNSQIFGTPVFNYTQNFSYIWDEVKLPITYNSNLEAASQFCSMSAASTRANSPGSAGAARAMWEAFLVPAFELKPNVFMKVTSNWLELSMRYVVTQKKAQRQQFHLPGNFKTHPPARRYPDRF